MNCLVVETKLSAYLDGELGGREMLAVRDHCALCPSCAQELAFLRETKLCAQQMAEVEIPTGLLERLEARVQAEQVPVTRSRSVLNFALIASAAAVVAVMTFNLLNTRSQTVGTSYAESVDISRDQASLEAGDPLAGPAPVYLAGYGH